jgi:hypothetical protein
MAYRHIQQHISNHQPKTDNSSPALINRSRISLSGSAGAIVEYARRKHTGRRRTMFVHLLLCIGISAGLLFLPSCQKKELTASMAKEVLEQNIGKCYGLSTPRIVIVTIPQNTQYSLVQLARDAGLVEMSQEVKSSGQSSDKFSVQLTEKGNAISHFEDMGQTTSFQISENEITEIISISKNGIISETGASRYVVLFSYTQKYTDLGQAIASEMQTQFNQPWIEDSTKLRGKATIYYDAFLKHYVVQDMMWSAWNREEWTPARFITGPKKDVALYYSYGYRETIVPVPTVPPPEPKTQERMWDAERINRERMARQEEQAKETQRAREAYQQDVERRNRDMERARLRSEVTQLEQEAEMRRRSAEFQVQQEERQREFERKNAERERVRRFGR